MSLFHIVMLLITGLFLGFVSGLLGIGGGIVMTPVQYWIYTSMGFNTDIAIKMAFGTTIAVVLPTAISGVLIHNNQKAIVWKVAIVMGIFTFFGSIIGATLTAHIPGSALKIAFGAIALISSIRMLIPRKTQTHKEPVNNIWVWIAWAIPIGLLTGILGVGGGIIVVPVLVMAMRFNMHQAVATSLGMMLFTSSGGIIGYIINGQNVPGLPGYTLGYIFLPAWLILTISSVGMARLGAVVSHRLRAAQLNYIFIALLFYIGLDMLGVFDFIGRVLK
jgi:uncharacterized membrane protein YfcA